MSASYDTPPLPARVPLRLRLAEHPGKQPLDGGWWPQSRDLVVEIRDLVDNFPPEQGRIVRVVYSPPDWDGTPTRVPTKRGYVKVGGDPKDDSHVVELTTSERAELCLLVVPPDMSRTKSDEALLAAVTPRYAPSPAALLAAVRERPSVDDGDHWNHEGEASWEADAANTDRREG